jgi:hypothetical protein
MYLYAFLLRMTNIMTSKNIDLSSWDILYYMCVQYLIYILILSSDLRLGLPRSSFPSDFATDVLLKYFIASIRITRATHLVLILTASYYSVNYVAPHYSIFSTLLANSLSYAQTFSSAPYSETS